MNDAAFMDIARTVALYPFENGKLPAGKVAVGCVIVSPDKRRHSFGYTGTPSGFPERDVPVATMSDEEWDRWCVHAEMNAITNARTDLTGWTLYSTKAPCRECAKAIVQAGVKRVVAPTWKSGRFAVSQIEADTLLRWCGVTRDVV